MRPLCAANRAPNSALGNVVARILKAVGDNICDKIGGEAISSEEVKHEIEAVNKKV